NGLTGLQAQGFHTLHASIDRLDKTSLLKRNAVGNPNRAALHDPIHHANIFGEAASGRLKTCRAAHLLIGGTLGKSLVTAVIAFAARDMVKDNNAVSRLEILDARSQRGYHARSFMT